MCLSVGLSICLLSVRLSANKITNSQNYYQIAKDVVTDPQTYYRVSDNMLIDAQIYDHDAGSIVLDPCRLGKLGPTI